MKNLLAAFGVLTATFVSQGAIAAPYCAALTSQETLPKTYAKRGPFHSDQNSGWIVGHDQLKPKFVVTSEAQLLWHEIREEFARRDIQLLILAAPPRPLFVPTDVLDGFNLDGARAKRELSNGFSNYIEALNTAGLIAPDLTELAASEQSPDYYFQRDTHWTPKGAALSAAHLYAAANQSSSDVQLDDVTFDQSYTEKGSLSAVVEKVCGARPDVEAVLAASYAKQGTATSLFAETSDTKLALIGTSFSDRYQRDAYQVADALAHVFDTSVENFALTGGGLVGSMLAFVESGALATGEYKTVVWESPYTAPLTDANGLRQVLGALRKNTLGTAEKATDAKISDEWVNIKESFNAQTYSQMMIATPGISEGKLVVELIGKSGAKHRIRLVKSNRIPSDLRSEHWSIALNALPEPDVARIKVRLVGEDVKRPTRITLFN